MPTLEERSQEGSEEKEQRLDEKTIEMGITLTFAKYLEQMEIYLLQLEKRVKDLETQCDSLRCRNKKG